MMGQVFDACTPRPQRDGKTFWLKIGRAWQNDKGQITLYLDAMPAPTMNANIEGSMHYQIHLFEPRDNNATGPNKLASGTRETADDAKARAGKGKGSKKMSQELDDEIPF